MLSKSSKEKLVAIDFSTSVWVYHSKLKGKKANSGTLISLQPLLKPWNLSVERWLNGLLKISKT